MLNQFEHIFAIKRVVKTTDDEHIKALRISTNKQRKILSTKHPRNKMKFQN